MTEMTEWDYFYSTAGGQEQDAVKTYRQYMRGEIPWTYENKEDAIEGLHIMDIYGLLEESLEDCLNDLENTDTDD